MPKKAKKQVKTPQPDWLWRYRVTVLRVLDGDTVEVLFDQGLGRWSMEICRLYGINTAEIEQDGGLAAKLWLAKELKTSPEGKLPNDLLIPTIWARTIKNRSQSKEIQEKYGRYLIELYHTPEAMDLGFVFSINQSLVDAGLARPYFGIGPKP